MAIEASAETALLLAIGGNSHRVSFAVAEGLEAVVGYRVAAKEVRYGEGFRAITNLFTRRDTVEARIRPAVGGRDVYRVPGLGEGRQSSEEQEYSGSSVHG